MSHPNLLTSLLNFQMTWMEHLKNLLSTRSFYVQEKTCWTFHAFNLLEVTTGANIDNFADAVQLSMLPACYVIRVSGVTGRQWHICDEGRRMNPRVMNRSANSRILVLWQQGVLACQMLCNIEANNLICRPASFGTTNLICCSDTSIYPVT